MQTKPQVRTKDQPSRRDVELENLVEEVAEDARALADRYPKETIVPEGGE